MTSCGYSPVKKNLHGRLPLASFPFSSFPCMQNLLSSLQSALAFARETLDGIHAERIARDHDRLLREEQDRCEPLVISMFVVACYN